MPLPAGTKLGTYEVRSAIGAGGMGEVYQAHDTNLGRDVAIKVLPEAFAHGVNRDDVRKAAEELGVPIEEHIAFCIAAMRAAADAIGLRGNHAVSAT